MRQLFINFLKGTPALCFLLMIVSCGPDPKSRVANYDPENFELFRELPQEKSKMVFENHIIENNRINILNYLYYYNGSGVAVGDINNDGLPDVYFAATVGKNRLFLNKGNLKFQDITESANVAGGYGITTGVNFVDINNDGFLDIYVCKSGVHNKTSRTNQLFINNGKLGFTEQASQYGLDDTSFSNQAYFFDMDRDGDLDMYLVNHPVDWPNINKIMTGEQEMEGFNYQFSDKLYNNNGRGRFEDVTRSAGLLNRSWGLSAAIGDFNEDGLPDIYVANDFIKPDNLYINNGDGTFSDCLRDYFRHISFFSMGADYADINNDGLNDLFVADMAMKDHTRSKRNMGSMSTENFQTIVKRGYHYPYSTNTLHLNLGNNAYTEIAQMSGVDKTDWSWSPLLVDVDNDGHKDLFITNGIFRDIIDNDFLLEKSLYDEQEARNYHDDLLHKIPQTKVKNFVFRNQGNLYFKDMSHRWGIVHATNSNGASFADLDMDGDLDIVTNNLNEPATVYENLAAGKLGHNFLKVKLTGTPQNINAIGATVEISYDNKSQRLDMNPARGYFSSSDYILHFGLGGSSEIDALSITWPDGRKTEIQRPEINDLIKINYATTEFAELVGVKNSVSLFNEITSEVNLNHWHEEIPYDDFARESLLPHKLSENGPFLAVADVNKDGLEDFYIGGAARKPAALYLQDPGGRFSQHSTQTWIKDSRYEDQRAIFFDADNDRDPDLYVVSGSNEFKDKSLWQDRLYINDGKGRFKRSEQALPNISSSGLDVAYGDFDNDGDLDLAVGGRVVPGKYPTLPKSYLLENRNGKFIDVTDQLAPGLSKLGMITDLEFSDYDGDDDLDLVVVGEWMPVCFFENDGHQFKQTTRNAGLAHIEGWWFSVTGGDIDNDGDIDYIIGNVGKNNKYQPAREKPLQIYYQDFDNNGTGDIVLSKIDGEVHYPVRGRECTAQQMPFVAKKFPDFKSFAVASLQDIYSKGQLSKALHYEAREFASGILINEGKGKFSFKYLPAMAQVSPLMSIKLLDLNADENLDIVAAGNFYGTETETIRYDGGSGICLIGDGSGNFSALPSSESGLYADGNVKDMAIIALANGSTGVLVAKNSDYLQLWGINNK
ncbi:VCBS repeat-containing protein [Fulvivirgaceae bacterium BMA12]|uniref:VCBS repeat-containing protein n=1 Tax=Agaribacillus aureus TaxID=3051825 RepID=A0ABT8LH18_9BACT|nr:VCBS repeat-containing protein [Fulvivirgaceae bacterium BMA12]